MFHNILNADVESGVNLWDNGYPCGGNWWSDYQGIDNYQGPGQNITGPDSIGDIPYPINNSDVDRYPLMSPWNYSTFCGDVNLDDKIDIADLTYLVGYLFQAGPFPMPYLCVGDVNNDSRVNIADLTFIVAYLFSGGQMPLPGCCNL